LAAACVAVIAGVYFQLLGHSLVITLAATAVVVAMAFLLTAIASYIVGLVGSSNSPVSGMTIMALLAIGALVYALGYEGRPAIIATLGVAGVACCVACTAGDICNDLKTGFLVGASPRRQQIVQVASVAVAALTIPPVLAALHAGAKETGGIGGDALPAPQAKLFATLVKGFFGDGEIPWGMVAIGAAVGVGLLAADGLLRLAGSRFRLHAMPVAVGIYLPLGIATPILLGGLLSWWLARRVRTEDDPLQRAVLLSAGIIAGESLVGVALGLMAALGNVALPATAVALLALAIVVVWLGLSAGRVSNKIPPTDDGPPG
jgi:putative OPT family oligopeptide transporter